ncbi:MAG: hypothetical protein FWH15_02165 [Betaproteobacteria bacterium]|nr:hypothetical protein [Betaproteobacteria bacterium]
MTISYRAGSNKMKTVLFSALLAGAVAAAHASEPQCDSEVLAGIHGDLVFLGFEGQSAKDIFNAMPESSRLSPQENCYVGVEMKIQGGFICRFHPNSIDPHCSYICSLEVSAKTGQVLERSRDDLCENDP